MDREFEKNNIFGLGKENSAYAQFFHRQVLSQPADDPRDRQAVFLQTSRLSRAAGTIGIFIVRERAADRSFFVWRGAVGIRNGARRHAL